MDWYRDPVSEIDYQYRKMRWHCSQIGKVPQIESSGSLKVKSLGDVGFMLEKNGARLVYGVCQRRIPKLMTLYTPEELRGRGNARSLMGDFCRHLDEQNKTIYLDPLPFEFHSDKELDHWKQTGEAESVWIQDDEEKKNSLIRFYSSFGFTESDKLIPANMPEISYYLVRNPQ